MAPMIVAAGTCKKFQDNHCVGMEEALSADHKWCAGVFTTFAYSPPAAFPPVGLACVALGSTAMGFGFLGVLKCGGAKGKAGSTVDPAIRGDPVVYVDDDDDEYGPDPEEGVYM